MTTIVVVIDLATGLFAVAELSSEFTLTSHRRRSWIGIYNGPTSGLSSPSLDRAFLSLRLLSFSRFLFEPLAVLLRLFTIHVLHFKLPQT